LLIKATDYIDNIFEYNGKKKTQGQSLEFPRSNLVDLSGYKIEGIPNKLKQSVCVASLMMIGGDELFTTQDSSYAVTSEKIGSISYTYDTSKVIKDSTLSQQINVLLRGLYKDKSGTKLITGRIKRV